MDDFQVRSVMEPIDRPNNKLYIKHSYSKGDEKKARIDHSSAHALLEGKKRKNKRQKRSWHDSFFFFVRDSLSKFLYVQYREGTASSVAAVPKKETARREQESFCLVSAQTHTDGHYLMTRKWEWPRAPERAVFNLEDALIYWQLNHEPESMRWPSKIKYDKIWITTKMPQ